MNKAELRIKYLKKRAALTASQKAISEDLALIQFQKLDIEIPSLIMTYAVIEKMNEFDPQQIVDYCYFKNPRHVLLYPVVDKKADNLQSVLVNDETEFKVNAYGIPEPVDALPVFPEEIDLVIVPLLAFDVKGYRVGYGKGYYDKFLKLCREDVIKVGFSFFDPEESIEGVDQYDVKLDYCINPERIYSF
jgi:5-formyltetrahydrofolate cyclo-ligase